MRIIIEKIKHWLRPGKSCRHFFPVCEYYDFCKLEFMPGREENQDGKTRIDK